jgi:hypothetical protein
MGVVLMEPAFRALKTGASLPVVEKGPPGTVSEQPSATMGASPIGGHAGCAQAVMEPAASRLAVKTRAEIHDTLRFLVARWVVFIMKPLYSHAFCGVKQSVAYVYVY